MHSEELENLIRAISNRYQYISSEPNIDYLSFENLIDNIINYYEDIINCLPGNVYWLDNKGSTVGCNKNVLSMFGFSSINQFKGLSFEDMGRIGKWRPGAIQKFKKDSMEVINTGKPILNTEEPPIPDNNGKFIYFLTSRVPLFDKKGNVIGLVGISIDITERKQMEEALIAAKETAEKASMAKTEFISNMSHDIRTPLNGVIGVAELLKKMGGSDIDREYGQMIYLASKQLLDLLNSVIDVVSIGQINENDIHLETFNIKELLEQQYDLMAASTRAKKLQLQFDIDPQIPTFIISDPLKLQRILQNLLANAIKFTENGFVKLQVKALTKMNHSIQIEFSIIDTGIGIAENQLNYIFDRFYRATPSYEGIYQGHGVGLFIVKKFVTLLAGDIQVKSTVGKGSSFSFVLTMDIGDEKNSTQSIATNQEINMQDISSINPHRYQSSITNNKFAIPSQPLKILFIEDNSIARYTGQILLQNMGCLVHAVENAEAAFPVIKSQTFDAIITDLGLPGIQGDEMSNMIRYWEKKSGRPPVSIMALTAHADNNTRTMCFLSGINHIYIKPLDENLLNIIIQQIKQNLANSDSVQVAPNNPKACDLTQDDLTPNENQLFQNEIYLLFDEEEGIKKAGGKAFLLQVLKLTVEDIIPAELINLKSAYSQKNWHEIQRIAHKIKGGALYCGTSRLVYACMSLENYLKAGHTQLADQLCKQLIDVIEQTYQILTTHLSDSLKQ